MKLISCHIENYGKISGADYTFDRSLTEFCEENGFGKSTLASFLKAMFYGLEADRKNSREFIERRHFYPFAGGSFGGHVTFEKGGNTYKIERYFDEKSDTRDMFAVYRNGVPWEIPSANAGEWAFGIDMQSFERTVFLTGEDLEIASTGSINSKLNNFVEGADGIGLDDALTRIDKTAKIYKKSRLGNDRITNATYRINRLSTEITNAEQIAEGLKAKYERYSACEREISRLNGEIARAQNENVVKSYWEQYDGITEEIERARAEIDRICALYPNGMPSPEDIKGAKRAAAERDKLRELSARTIFSKEEEAEFSCLSRKFAAGVPSQAALKECGSKIEEYTALVNEISLKNSAAPTERQLAAAERFGSRPLDGGYIERLDGLLGEYTEAERTYAELSAPRAALPAKRGGRHKLPYIAGAIVCAAAVAAGIAAVFFSVVAGAVLLALGITGLVCDGFIYLNRKTAYVTGGGEEPSARNAALRLDRVRDELQSMLQPYGYEPEKGFTYSVAQLEDEWREYCTYEQKSAERARELEQKCARRDGIKEEIESFFLSYGAEGGAFVEMLADLKTDAGVYLRLCDRKSAEEQERLKWQSKEKVLSAHIAEFISVYDPAGGEEGIALAERHAASLAAARETEKNLTERAEKFIGEKGLTERPEGGAVDLEELNRLLTEAQDRKNRLRSEISDDEEIAEKTVELKEAQTEEKRKLEGYKARYKILCAAAELMKTADRRLKDRYVKPVLEKFRHYSLLLERAIGEEVVMDSEFEIRFEKNGRERSEKHLSSGQRSICVFCFRMALIGNMYPDEKPFLIMDDPFVNLDGVHLEKIKEVLKELSGDFQIIYFTCHKSRALAG